jgi:CBS domain containing-hemolysin-like protein
MADTSSSRPPRASGDAGGGGLFRNWLRSVLRGKSEDAWRDTIEELIEDRGDTEDVPAVAGHERVLLQNILKLRDLTAIDVMVPRADIIAIKADTTVRAALHVFAEEQHSRLPVYRENLDDVLGMVHVKDVITLLDQSTDGDAEPPALSTILRPALIVAPSMPVMDLLLQMREKRQHLALVIDEFGGIDGLITIEDLVEQIVGEIEDEHDIDDEAQLIEKPDGSFVADARLPIEEFEERVGAVLDPDDADDIDTLGGLVFAIAGRIPSRGEILEHPRGFEFEVIDADPRRIKRLRVRRKPQAVPADAR